jgi:Rrf2 family transcriptional regulator, iron-sulfur cluster assembly transcription factor
MAISLSTSTHHGIRIILCLAQHAAKGPISVAELSGEEGISVKYIEQLVRVLKQANLITSVRGPKGGHQLNLNVPPREITLGQIVRLFEGRTDLVPCIGQLEHCVRSDGCPVRRVLLEATESLISKLDGTSIADLMTE